MSSTTFRTDPEVEAALDRLIADGTSRSEAIRRAILDADRRARNERIRAEAAAIMADPEQVAETMRVNRYMDSLRAW